MTDPAPRDRLAGGSHPPGVPFLPKERGRKEGPKRGISIFPLFGISPFKNDQSGDPNGPDGPIGERRSKEAGRGMAVRPSRDKANFATTTPPYWRHPPGALFPRRCASGKLAVPPGVPKMERGGIPVPPAEAVTAGAAPPTKRKDERRRLPFACAPCQGPRKSPFFFGIQNRFFFKGEKEMVLAPGGRCPPRWGSVTARLKGDFLFRRPAHQVI